MLDARDPGGGDRLTVILDPRADGVGADQQQTVDSGKHLLETRWVAEARLLDGGAASGEIAQFVWRARQQQHQ